MDRRKNKKFRWGQMQFNLVNDQEQVVQFVWRGVALALGFTSILRGCLQRL